MRPAVLAWVALFLPGVTAQAAETCRYVGTASYSGAIEVVSTASTANGETTVDVAARVSARSFGLIAWQYLYQEIGIWRGGELVTAAVNHRYSAAGRIRRQQWDVFRQAPEGMIAWRAQAKTLADFQARYPVFAQVWDSATFGIPWLRDYPFATAERRADLDLPRTAMPPGLGIPLAMAFHWVRWAGPDGVAAAVFLPGFKRDSRLNIPVTFLGTDAAGLTHLRAAARHPQMSPDEASTGDAWVGPDHRLMRLTFEARGANGNAQGEVRLNACRGNASGP